jgi:hypothetical protein
VCEDFRLQAHQAGIPMAFTLSLIPSNRPDQVKVSIDIEKGKWPHRKTANVQVREREEGEISNYAYSVRYQTGQEVNHSLSSFRREGVIPNEDLKENLYKFICEKILDTKEFTALRMQMRMLPMYTLLLRT